MSAVTSEEELYVIDPEEFVAARDGLVRELRAAGDKDAAAAVKRLRRPPVLVWALNRVAVDAPEVVRAAVEAAASASAAQRDVLHDSDRDVLRDALTRRRRAFDAVAGRAREVIASSGRRFETYERDLEDAMHTISTAPARLEEWSQGRLTHVDAGTESDLLADLAASVDAPRTAASSRAARSERPEPAEQPPSRQLVQARERRDRRRTEADEAAVALENAQRALDDAEALAAQAQRALRAAQAEHDRARHAHDRAEEALRRSEDELDGLEP